MKKILFLIILLINFGPVFAKDNPYNESGPYGTNCTWYAWKMAKEKAGVSLSSLGDAKDWYYNAQKKGYLTGNIPKKNSIVVWSNWTNYGHVGYVEKVEGNILYVWDSTGPCIDREDPEYISCIMNGVSEESDKICNANAKRIACEYSINPSEYTIAGYIYLDEIPKLNEDNNNEENTKKEEVTKSSNSYLSNITLSEGIIEFDKNIQEYNIILDNSIDKIEINGILEDNKATLNGNGFYNLNVGLNKITLKVTAEDKSVKEYIINIKRKEKNKEKEEIIINDDDNNIINSKILYLVLSCLVIIISLIVYKKRKRV